MAWNVRAEARIYLRSNGKGEATTTAEADSSASLRNDKQIAE
jgi:hypothetical protein